MCNSETVKYLVAKSYSYNFSSPLHRALSQFSASTKFLKRATQKIFKWISDCTPCQLFACIGVCVCVCVCVRVCVCVLGFENCI